MVIAIALVNYARKVFGRVGGPGRFAVVEQQGARIPAGGEVRLYFVGSSNVAWQTWPDQLHMYLSELGYTLPTEAYAHANLLTASDLAPKCDDQADFQSLQTPRIGYAGWGSWNFAFDSDDDCAATPYQGHASGVYPFRTIAGHAVSCLSGWGCKPDKEEAHQRVRPAAVAEDAKHADVVLLSHWINDFKQQYSGYSCFNSTKFDSLTIVDITVEDVRRLIRAVHKVNPSALVLVLALRPEASGPRVVPEARAKVAAINGKIKDGVQEEPNTAFVDFRIPDGIDMFQTAHPGHLNCRGDRLMAHSVLKALYERRVIANSLAPLPAGEVATCQVESNCAGITDQACCQAAASCRVARSGKCVPYGPGVGR
uniref:Uncharacterized protein n=1 Tax=Zooxanthella nutricula TaxID=1333877 RepID=A0A7S2PAU3_9DINO